MHVILQRIFLISTALLAGLLATFTLYLCYILEWRGPMRDLWEFIPLMESAFKGHWDWSSWLEPYGGIHRIFLPKLVFYLDYRFASGSNLLSLSLTLLLHISACGLLLHSTYHASNFKREDKLFLASIGLLFFFSTTQIYNLIYNSDNQVVISNSLAIWSAWFFIRKHTVLANGMVIAACLSHSSSLMLLPAYIVLSMALGYPKKTIVWQCVFAVVLLGIYISGADPLENHSNALPFWQKLPVTAISLLMQVEGILHYIGLHLSSPASRLWPTAGIVITYISITYLFFITWRVYKKHWHAEPADLFWLTLALYVFFIAVITAMGRQIYPNSALTDRYQTLVMTFWPALLFLLYRDLKSITTWSIPFISVFSLALLLPHQYSKAVEMAWLASRVNMAHTAATVGITDMNIVGATLSHPLLMDKKNLVEKHNDFLRDYGLGYFSDDGSEYFLSKETPILLEKPVSKEQTCSGELLTQKTVSVSTDNTIAFRLEGYGHVNGKSVATVLIVDALGQVIGLGRNQRARGEFRPLSWQKPDDTRWVGFVRGKQRLQYPLTIVASRGESYCEIFTFTPTVSHGEAHQINAF